MDAVDGLPSVVAHEIEVTYRQESIDLNNIPIITKDKFHKIKIGMSYEEVSSIVGSYGEVVAEAGGTGDGSHTYIVYFEGWGELGANALLESEGGKLVTKVQSGLK